MRHDSHYVEDLVKGNRSIGKVIAINLIEPNPDQPRVEIGDLSELSSSIKQKGVLEPLLVKPVRETGRWMIIAGERRWRAANLAGLREVPCIELDIDDQSVAEIALIENLQRKDLTIWEEADGLAALARTYGYTHEEIARKIAKSRTTVTESMTIAGIPENIRERCRQARISAKSTLLEIARQFDDRAMEEYVAFLIEGQKQASAIEKTEKAGNVPPRKEKSLRKFEGLDRNPSPSAETNRFDSGTFKYRSEAFAIEIKFPGKTAYGKKEILKALKETFDQVKARPE
ncbi:MAG: ParB/RepB/Spo0J family partition protein [Acidobacteria bacterium]|nr:ParB/RepB/Spo0J family partition protein [Acidobacteriota bacterium]